MNTLVQIANNRINPLLLRELRQMVRNRFIIVLLNLFLAVLVTTCFFFTLTVTPYLNEGAGGTLFGFLTAITGFTCCLAVLGSIGTATATERMNEDLTYFSTLSPTAIVFGKAWSGAVITLMLMSAAAPFVMLAYLLRGLDIQTIVISFLSLFLSVQVLNSIVIWCAAGIKTKAQMIRLYAVAVICFWGGSILLSGIMVGFAMRTPNLSLLMLTQILTASSLIAICLSLGIAAFSPQTSNRMMPFRWVITIIYLGSPLLYLLDSVTLSSVTIPIEAWVISWYVALCILMFFVTCETDNWSVRVKRTIPKNILLRILFFPFYTGAANGLVWLFLLLGGVLLVQMLAVDSSSSSLGMRITIDDIVPWLLFCFDYSVTALFIRIRFSRWIKPQHTVVVVIVLGLVLILGGAVAYVACESDGGRSVSLFEREYGSSLFSMFNPLLLFEISPPSFIYGSASFTFQQFGACVWAVLLVFPFVVWLSVRAVQFSPNKVSGVMTLDEAVAAVAAAQKGKEKNKP